MRFELLMFFLYRRRTVSVTVNVTVSDHLCYIDDVLVGVIISKKFENTVRH